jgi:site-specific DNA recombinase
MPYPKDFVPKRDGIIYARVSSKKQATEGHGLDGQIMHCNMYAQSNNIEVIKIFEEEGVSGSLDKRPSLEKLYAFVESYNKQRKNEKLIVLLYDVSRLSRDTVGYRSIKDKLENLGCEVQYVTHKFDGDSSGRFIEEIMVSVAQMERLKNAERTADKMAARVEVGYYVYGPVPLGYKPSPVRGLREPDENSCHIVKQVMEGYAVGLYKNFTEIANYLNEQDVPNHQGVIAHFDGERVKNLMHKAWYHAGFVQCLKRGISRRKGLHKAIISADILDKIEARLKGKKVSPYRKKSEHFPLRGHIRCGCCDRLLTAAFCGGKTKKYGYYYCKTHDCPMKDKNIRYKHMHGLFLDLIKSTIPKPQLIEYSKACFANLWKEETEHFTKQRQLWGQEILKINKDIESCVDEILNAEDSTIKDILKQRMKKLHERKETLEVKINQYADLKDDFGDIMIRVIKLFQKPAKIWEDGSLKMRQTIQTLIFPKGLIYDHAVGDFRKPEKPLLFLAIGQFMDKKTVMAHPGGFEPPTF